MVHIGEFLVLTAHSPDEGIVLCTNAGVDGPRGRNNSLLVVHNDVAGLLCLTHHMEYGIAGAHIKIEVNLHTSVVSMAGHGVPVRANLKLGKSHCKLAGLHNLGVYVLIDNSLVAILYRSAGHLARLGDIDLNGGIGGVCRAGCDVELCRVLFVTAIEGQPIKL